MGDDKKAQLIGEAIKELHAVKDAMECGLYLSAVIEDAIELLCQALGWPPGYFEKTAGSLADDPIVRGSQGEYEKREELE